jgi:DNA modification methylase
VKNYFADMLECFREMRRVLKIGGKACIVIGNTELQGVAIRNAEVFVEQMESIGLTVSRIIKRAIPSKILPQTRDPNNGRFTSATASNRVLAYPVEYILIMERTD